MTKKLTVLSAGTKKAQALIEAYNESNVYSIYGVPECTLTPARVREERRRWALCTRGKGWLYRVISVTRTTYTSMWQTPAGFRVETGRGSYLIV